MRVGRLAKTPRFLARTITSGRGAGLRWETGLCAAVFVLAIGMGRPAAAVPSGGALATVGLTRGWATFGQVLPPGAAYGDLRIGDLPTQTDIKRTWPDGSVRFAVLSARVSTTGTYPVAADPSSVNPVHPPGPGAAGGLLALGMPDVKVLFATGPKGPPQGGSNIYTARLPQGASLATDLWLSGPLVTEWRAIVVPIDADGKPHPFLRVIFDVRSYNDGASRVDVAVENTLDLQGATAEEYAVNIVADEKSVFSRDSVYHPYLTRWRQVFTRGPTAAEVTPDFEPFYLAKALPRYWSGVTDDVSYPGGPTFDILGPGALESDMPRPGGRAELAPYPDWTARYLAHKNPDQGRFVLVHGDLAGSWPVHVREPEDGRLVSIDERANLWLDPRGQSPSVPEDDRPRGDLGATGQLRPDIAHQPSLAYVPYLLTGDRYYADEMAFWANYVLLATFQDPASNARGGGNDDHGDPIHPGSWGCLCPNETRGVAWGLRNLVDAAAYLPDNEPARAYLAAKVRNNLQWLESLGSRSRPVGLNPHSERRPSPREAGYPLIFVALWEHNYLAWAIDHANKQGYSGGESYRNQIAQFQLSLFASEPAYQRLHAAPYLLAIGERDGAGEGQYYSTLGEVFQRTFGEGRGSTPFPGSYGVDARLMLLIGIENGWKGAQEAYDYLWPLIGRDPFLCSDRCYADLELRAGWALILAGRPGQSANNSLVPTQVPPDSGSRTGERGQGSRGDPAGGLLDSAVGSGWRRDQLPRRRTGNSRVVGQRVGPAPVIRQDGVRRAGPSTAVRVSAGSAPEK